MAERKGVKGLTNNDKSYRSKKNASRETLSPSFHVGAKSLENPYKRLNTARILT